MLGDGPMGPQVPLAPLTGRHPPPAVSARVNPWRVDHRVGTELSGHHDTALDSLQTLRTFPRDAAASPGTLRVLQRAAVRRPSCGRANAWCLLRGVLTFGGEAR